MLGSIGGSRYRNTRQTASSKGSSNDKQNPLDNRPPTGPKTRLPVGKRRQDRTGNGSSKDVLRQENRKEHAEEQHLSRHLDKKNLPLPKYIPKQKTSQQEDNLRQSSTNPQKTGAEIKPPYLLNGSVKELLTQSPQSPSRKAATVPPGGAGAKSPVPPQPKPLPNIPDEAPTVPAQTQTPALDVPAAQPSGNQGGGVAATDAPSQQQIVPMKKHPLDMVTVEELFNSLGVSTGQLQKALEDLRAGQSLNFRLPDKNIGLVYKQGQLIINCNKTLTQLETSGLEILKQYLSQPQQSQQPQQLAIENGVMVSGGNFGEQDGNPGGEVAPAPASIQPTSPAATGNRATVPGAPPPAGASPARTASVPVQTPAQTPTPAPSPARTAAQPTSPAPPTPSPSEQTQTSEQKQTSEQTPAAAQPPSKPLPPTPPIKLKIQRKDIGHQPNINNWVDASTDDRGRLGGHIFSAQGDISIVFSDGGSDGDIPTIYQKESVKEYAQKPEDLIEDVFQRSPLLTNENLDHETDAKTDPVMDGPKFDNKMKNTILRAIKCGDKFKHTLTRKGVGDKAINDVLSENNIQNTKLLTSQEKLVVLFAAIEVLHQVGKIEPSDIGLLQEIKVVLEAFKTIDNANRNSLIMTKLESNIHSNEGAEQNNAFEDFINHALFLHQNKIQNITGDVHIGLLKVSNITCQVGSFADASGIAGEIIAPCIGVGESENTLIISPEVSGSAPSVADEQEKLTKQLQEHLTKLKQEFDKYYKLISSGSNSDVNFEVKDEFRKIVVEFGKFTEVELMGNTKNKLYELISKLHEWKTKSCGTDDIAGNLNKIHDPFKLLNQEPMSKEDLGQLINDLHDTAERLKLVEPSQA